MIASQDQTTAPAVRRVLKPREVAEFLSVPPKQVYSVIRLLPASAKFREEAGRRWLERSRKILDQLVAEAQDHGLGYEPLRAAPAAPDLL